MTRERIEAARDKVHEILLSCLRGDDRYVYQLDGASFTRWGLVDKDIRSVFFALLEFSDQEDGEEPGDTDRDMADHEGWGL